MILPIAAAWGTVAVVGARRIAVDARALVLVAIGVRLCLVGTPPHLSDDLYRYLWEGAALNAGHDPFAEAPVTIDGLDDALRARVNHPEVTSIYPPLALLWFRLLALGGTPAFVQLATALVDATVPLALLVATRRPWTAWLYALHPLPVLESAAGGHLDLPAAALGAWAVAAWRRGRPEAAWLLATGGALVKLFPAAWMPALLRRTPLPRAVLRVAMAVAITLILAAPVLGPHLLDGMHLYATTWEFDGFLYPWLVPLLGGSTRRVLVAIAAIATAYALWRHEDPGEAWATIGAAFVLLSPTVHPWYVVWALVPALLCGRIGWAAAAVPLLGTYAVLFAFDPTTGAWAEASWVWWITWPPALAALGATARFSRS